MALTPIGGGGSGTPTIADGSLTIAKTSGLQTALDAKAAVTFSRTSAQHVRSGFAVGIAGSTNMTASNGVLYLRPIRIGKGGTVTTLRINCSTLAASSTVRCGLWAHDATTGLPTTLIVDWGTTWTSGTDTTTTGIKGMTISQALADDTTYWLGAVAQGGSPGLSATNAESPLLPAATNANGNVGSLFVSGVSGALASNPSGLATTISMPNISLVA